MIWLFAALAWVALSTAAALIVGAAIADADRAEQHRDQS